jgi:2-oxoglutarate dehydrogenase E2 component (dihydrolipoamide succinyltransferase)
MDIKVPEVGESITEAEIGEWLKQDGDYVQRDEVILTLETDKASVEVVAEAAGKLTTKAAEGDTVEIGAVIATLDTSAEAPAGGASETSAQAAAASTRAPSTAPATQMSAAPDPGHLSPAVRKAVNEKGVDPSTIQGTGRGGRLTKEDVMKAPAGGPKPSAPAPSAPAKVVPVGETERVKMTTIRRKIAERLVNAQQTAAILTTFNEVDMTALMTLRNQYKDDFEKKHGVRLGFMGFFVKATIEALKAFPAVNASIDGSDILYHHFHNIGVAVSSPKGLVVPVLKNADQMSLAEIEQGIKDYALKARDGKISIDDMSGGTFTISNGGVFGSLMSTPILNPPQSGILGMHKIEKRPVVIGDEIKIRPMMYLALSYDHRMIDGKESVSFLVKIKENIEDPSRILLQV